MEVKNHINTTLATAKWWPRPLNRGGRWIDVSNTTVYWKINRDFGKWPLNGGWPLNRGLTEVVLFWTKYAVPRQIKPGILELITSRGQRILCIVFIFVSCEEKGCYRIVSLGPNILTADRTAGLASACKVPFHVTCGKARRGVDIMAFATSPDPVPLLSIKPWSKRKDIKILFASKYFIFARNVLNFYCRCFFCLGPRLHWYSINSFPYFNGCAFENVCWVAYETSSS